MVRIGTDTATFERPRTIGQYQQMFGHIYGDANKKYSDEELLLRLVEEIAELMELARKDRRKEFSVHLPRIFAWYNALANRLGIDLQEVLWYKYPGVCSYCLREKNCSCAIEHPEIPDRETVLRRLRRERYGREPKTLKDHVELHERLYGRQNERIFLIQTVAHLAEEAGELSKELRHKNADKVKDEMADIFSWTAASAIRLGLDLDEIVWTAYPYECELCHCEKCRCENQP